MERIELRTQYIDSGKFCMVPLILPGTEGSLCHWTDEANKTYLCFTLLQTENISRVQRQAGSTLPQKVFINVVFVYLWAC